MLKHPAPSSYKFFQCNFLTESIGLLNFDKHYKTMKKKLRNLIYPEKSG